MMRLVSGQNPLYMVAVLSLVIGLTACSKKEEQEQTAASPQTATQVQNTAQTAQNVPSLPTYSPPAAGQQAPQPTDTRELAPAFVPAPLSPDQQLRVQRERAARQVENEYTCKNGTKFKAMFTRQPHAVSITFPGRVTVTLPQKNANGIGFWYESDQYTLRGRGPHAQWVMKGRDPVECTVSVLESTQ